MGGEMDTWNGNITCRRSQSWKATWLELVSFLQAVFYVFPDLLVLLGFWNLWEIETRHQRPKEAKGMLC